MRVTRTLRATAGAALTGALLLAAGGTASADQVRVGQWPLEAFGAQQLWKQATGKGVTVAVLDSGFRETHQDLTGQFLPGPDFANPSVRPTTPRTSGRRKTSVTTAPRWPRSSPATDTDPAAPKGVKGLAPDAKILPVPRVQERRAATRWAVDHGADVINMSYSESTPCADTCAAIHYALEKGVVVVAGVGQRRLSKKSYPAGLPRGDRCRIGRPVRRGIDDDNNYNSDLDLLAPGEQIPVAMGKSDSDYRTADGSSAATAYVSAAAALLKEKFPDLTPGQIANRLVKTAGLSQAREGQAPQAAGRALRLGLHPARPRAAEGHPGRPGAGPLPMPKGKAPQKAVVPGADKGQDPDPPMGAKDKLMLYGGIGVGVLLVAGIIIGVVVAVRRRNNPGNQAWG